ncbi:hypothetical protein SASPL_156619 [Salvia splendens]|uniref:Inhibitor of growth protein N-terminal histone-binding domain-containing protein n=1 Tax=Salvia splendens TaxID=180675 RepID=A0A8X8VWI0_SALSN|nr:hypothetical protein SASPL_156619 [Salvia splendens]
MNWFLSSQHFWIFKRVRKIHAETWWPCFLVSLISCILYQQTEIQKQNEQHCEQEIDDMKRGIKSGSITPNSSLLKFTDDAVDEQKHAIRIANEKVELAVQAYDLVLNQHSLICVVILYDSVLCF